LSKNFISFSFISFTFIIFYVSRDAAADVTLLRRKQRCLHFSWLRTKNKSSGATSGRRFVYISSTLTPIHTC